MSDPFLAAPWLPTVLAGAVAAAVGWRGYRRLGLSLAKHPSLAGHVRMSKRFAALIPQYVYSKDDWYGLDGVEPIVRARRRRSFDELVAELTMSSPQTLAQTQTITPRISDAQFTRRYRIPFQFRNADVQKLKVGNIWQSSEGPWLKDLDGQRYLDLSGSYGVNLFGLDFYKSRIDEAVEHARDLGPLLGGYHPCITEVTERLLAISGMEEISFHMSGTEAVMQAVRLARYNSGRRRVVRFCGAYHGWWDDVQPGPGNPMPPARHTLTLRELHERTLQYLRTAKDIACVLVNPIQAMHPNRSAPSDSTLLDGSRSVAFDRAAYSEWLKALREICSARDIAFIMDEVFLGFRLAPGGAQEYFGVTADLVCYGKTLGGGLPVGVLCGKSRWMQRFRENRPADICFARGTFNAHPYVLTAMQSFLRQMETPQVAERYRGMDELWEGRRDCINRLLAEQGVPARFEGLPTVWSLVYTQPGRYHWLFQFYLRREGIALSWVGTGRFIFHLGFSDQDFAEFSSRFLKAALRFRQDGWWAIPSGLTFKKIKRQVLVEVLLHRLRGA